MIANNRFPEIQALMVTVLQGLGLQAYSMSDLPPRTLAIVHPKAGQSIIIHIMGNLKQR